VNYSTPQVAGASRQTVRTIRHWETLGLFGKVARDRRGDRVFTQEQFNRAQIVAAASMAGMGLEEIKNAPDIVLLAKIAEASYFMESVRGMQKAFDL